MLGGGVTAYGHVDYQVQGLPQGHCENSICGAVASPLFHFQDASYKTCLFGLVF